MTADQKTFLFFIFDIQDPLERKMSNDNLLSIVEKKT